MKRGTKAWKLKDKLLKINPNMTVGQFAQRLKIMNDVIKIRKEKVYA